MLKKTNPKTLSLKLMDHLCILRFSISHPLLRGELKIRKASFVRTKSSPRDSFLIPCMLSCWK